LRYSSATGRFDVTSGNLGEEVCLLIGNPVFGTGDRHVETNL
jgi:hypothetical protein